MVLTTDKDARRTLLFPKSATTKLFPGSAAIPKGLEKLESNAGPSTHAAAPLPALVVTSRVASATLLTWLLL
jgi:hypothetical protein